jgi:hypothetical protein
MQPGEGFVSLVENSNNKEVVEGYGKRHMQISVLIPWWAHYECR